jgi:D-3-phosphoglycerate dehydrogenase
MRIAIPDDYQDVIRSLDCFKRLSGHEVSVFHDKQPASLDELATRFASADALVLTRERTRIDAALLDRLPNLKLISQTGKVAGHLDLEACTARGIVVTEGRGSPVAPAELAWALILNARRQLVPAIEAFKQGQWQVNLGQAVAGQVLGIWGYGKIGQRLARYAQAFDMPVLVCGAAKAAGQRPRRTGIGQRNHVRRSLPRPISSA